MSASSALIWLSSCIMSLFWHTCYWQHAISMHQSCYIVSHLSHCISLCWALRHACTVLLQRSTLHYRCDLQQHHSTVAQGCDPGCFAAGGCVQDSQKRSQVWCPIAMLASCRLTLWYCLSAGCAAHVCYTEHPVHGHQACNLQILYSIYTT